MKRKKLLTAMAASMIFLISSIAFASPYANILYQETALGNGSWQYDYTFNNTSDTDEYLYNIWLDFSQEAEITGMGLPAGWSGSVWEGTNTTLYLEASSTGFSYDIPAGNSKSGFSFLINYQAGAIPYTAYFDDHAGNISPTSGTTALVPEPISAMLFLSGGAALIARRRFKVKR